MARVDPTLSGAVAASASLWAWGGTWATDTPAVRGVELRIGDEAMALSPYEIAAAVVAPLPR